MPTRKRNWPVVDGVPVRPYEIEEDQRRTAKGLADMRDDYRKEAELTRTQERRALDGAVKSIKARKGKGFERTLFGRYTIEWHRLEDSGSLDTGVLYRIELYRRRRWDLNIEFWRAR